MLNHEVKYVFEVKRRVTQVTYFPQWTVTQGVNFQQHLKFDKLLFGLDHCCLFYSFIFEHEISADKQAFRFNNFMITNYN